MCLVLLCCLLPSFGTLSGQYELTFSDGTRNVTRAYAGDVLDVTLFATGASTLQEGELRNFHADLSDLELVHATYVQGSLTNRLDPADTVPVDNGFLKAFDIRDGQRVSLTSQIRFQLFVPQSNEVLVRCKGNGFTLYDSTSQTWVGNREKEFQLIVQPRKVTCKEAEDKFVSTCCLLSDQGMETTYVEL